jgi:hypothetical protein
MIERPPLARMGRTAVTANPDLIVESPTRALRLLFYFEQDPSPTSGILPPPPKASPSYASGAFPDVLLFA